MLCEVGIRWFVTLIPPHPKGAKEEAKKISELKQQIAMKNKMLAAQANAKQAVAADNEGKSKQCV